MPFFHLQGKEARDEVCVTLTGAVRKTHQVSLNIIGLYANGRPRHGSCLKLGGTVQ